MEHVLLGKYIAVLKFDKAILTFKWFLESDITLQHIKPYEPHHYIATMKRKCTYYFIYCSQFNYVQVGKNTMGHY